LQNERSVENRSEAPDLREYLHVLRRRKWTIALILALVVGSTLAFSVRQTPVYAATVKVLVKPINASQVLQGVPASSIIDLETEQGLVETPVVAKLAAQSLGGGAQPDELLRHVSVEIPANTQFLQITFSSTDARLAAAGAQAFAQAYLTFRRTQATDAYATAAQGYEQQIQQLQNQLADKQAALSNATVGSPEAASLQADVSSLTSRIAIVETQAAPLLAPSVDPGQIVTPAVVPTSPASPNYVRNVPLALTVGLLLGVGVAFLRERLDDRLSSREDFEERLGAPVLGVVPKRKGLRNKQQDEIAVTKNPNTPMAEGYRTIRANVQHLTRKGDLRILMVTSPMIGDGKTTVAANLAVVLAQAGKRVLVVSCDLHRPRLHRFFNLDNEVGLTSVVGGLATLGDAIRRPGLDTLLVLPSGPAIANPAELLASDEMERLLAELSRSVDFMILDMPPVIAVADVLILAPKTDGVLLVVDANSTTRDALGFARRQIEQVGAKILGGVYHKFDPSRARTSHPYYYYYYHSGRQPENGQRKGEGRSARRGRRSAETQRPEGSWR
jgi:non-specific protein-tyrosine kinase